MHEGEVMAEAAVLEKIIKELDFLKNKITKIEVTLDEIDNDLHELNPAYLKRLEKMKKEGTITSREFEERVGVKV